jgi:hypothetical protein
MQGQYASAQRLIVVKKVCPPGQKYCSKVDRACSTVCTEDLALTQTADEPAPLSNLPPQVCFVESSDQSCSPLP